MITQKTVMTCDLCLDSIDADGGSNAFVDAIGGYQELDGLHICQRCCVALQRAIDQGIVTMDKEKVAAMYRAAGYEKAGLKDRSWYRRTIYNRGMPCGVRYLEDLAVSERAKE